MKITQVTVSYGETQSLPEYSNVKPHLSLTAEIEPQDDPTQIEFELWAWARDWCTRRSTPRSRPAARRPV